MKNKYGRIPIIWKAPPSDFMKFNVDGSSKGKPEPAGIGGVLRDNSATIKIVFSKVVGVVESNAAELLAVREALRIFVSSRWVLTHRLIIESDSSNVVNWVCNSHDIPWIMKRFMGHLENFKEQLLGWEIVFILREGNDLANALAKSRVSRHHDLVVLYE